MARLDAGARLEVPLPVTHSAFAYAYDGDLSIGPADSAQRVVRGQLAVLGDGELDEVAAQQKFFETLHGDESSRGGGADPGGEPVMVTVGR